ncbi:MAG: hypothetical protein EHM65_08240 [Acidobacteriales bacterium]|nr:MAG: hypothetical protein EHM65_08240 [Terriglobales bacterium]
MTPYRRITRLKQFIMDHYIFNLDLDTWGLTTQERELARFKNFVNHDTLAESNALFGYQGDKYYFDSGIRQHFGLDKYEGNVIPYWKTETVEAMDAFRFKPAYVNGAGECVSLATLYAAALFVVAGVPLKQIYLMATPLHSQNYVDIGEGILTNNRRLVTKNMWFNGTELSAQARRALENERVTVVAHETGYIHTIYETATIDAEAYDHFVKRLRHYLRTPLTVEILGNFIRQASDLQKCFQLRWQCCGADVYFPLEKVFAYERDSPYLVTDNTRDKLMQEIDREVFEPQLLPDRIVLNDLEAFARDNRINLDKPRDVEALMEKFARACLNAKTAIESLVRFCHLEPRLPDAASRKFTHGEGEALGIEAGMGRDQIIQRLDMLRASNSTVDLAFYAYRDLNRTEPEPYVHSSIQRSPVSVGGSYSLDEATLVEKIQAMPNESIYDGAGRLAQPDEVWNYQRGDGVEKAMLLANLLRARHPSADITVRVAPDRAICELDAQGIEFPSTKQLRTQDWPIPKETEETSDHQS